MDVKILRNTLFFWKCLDIIITFWTFVLRLKSCWFSMLNVYFNNDNPNFLFPAALDLIKAW